MSSAKFTIISNSNPTKARVILKETVNGVSTAVALDSGDTITARIHKNGSPLSTQVSVNLSADGTSLASGKIVPEWTQVESATWATGDAELWVVRNNVPWLPAKVKIIKRPD